MTEQPFVPTDEALMEAYARRGDDSAFEALVARHAGWIMASAYRQLKDRQLAEDATQAVFVLLCRRGKKWREGTSVGGWLFLTMRYTVLAMCRNRALRQRHERAAVEAKAMQAEAGETVSRGELAEYLDEAVARLPGRERAVVLLRFYRGMDFPAIAEAEGISQHAARKRVERAVDRLRRRLGGQGVTSTAIGAAAVTGYLGRTAGVSAVGEASYGSICQLALSARQGAALPLTVDAAVKGAAGLMALAQAKIVALVAAACILLATAVPVGMSQLRQRARPAAPPVVVPAVPPARVAPTGPITAQRIAGQLQLTWRSVTASAGLDPRTRKAVRQLRLVGSIKLLDDSNILGIADEADLTEVFDQLGQNIGNKPTVDQAARGGSHVILALFHGRSGLSLGGGARPSRISGGVSVGEGALPERLTKISGTYGVMVGGKTTIKDIPLVEGGDWQELAPGLAARFKRLSVGDHSIEYRLEGKPGASGGNFSGLLRKGEHPPSAVITGLSVVDEAGKELEITGGGFNAANSMGARDGFTEIGRPVMMRCRVATEIQVIPVPFSQTVTDLEVPALAPGR